MNTDYRFSELLYTPTDFDAVRSAFNEVIRQIRDASSVDDVLAAIKEHDGILDKISYASALCYIRMSQHSLDEKLAEAVEYEFENAAQLPDAEFARALLESPFLPELEKRFGKEYRPRIEKDFRLKKAGLDLLAEEKQYMALYQQKKAALRVSFRGKTYSTGKMNAFLESPDRETRKEAKKAVLEAYLDKKNEFISFLQKTVKTRDALAKANGFSDFAAYMDVSYDRNGYGKKEIEAFCTEVKEQLVPLLTEIKRKKAEQLGLDKIMRYDAGLSFLDGNPVPRGGPEELTKAAITMYDSLSPELGTFFRNMVKTESLDVTLSNEKVSGMGFQTELNSNYLPFVFANCTGIASDVDTFTHEIGHAWQQVSTWKAGLPSLFSSMPQDACEIPSRTMEMFTYPFAEEFFGKDAAKFRYSHFCTALREIADFCESHELETFTLTHPDISFEALTAKALEIERSYNPDVDGGELEHFYQEGVSILQSMPLYMVPFYGIGYSLSWICAMQFYQRFCEDRENALATYNKLCSLDGSLSYPELLKAAGLKSPFEKGALEELVAFARKELARLEKEVSYE